ncbi:hypothetical protein [Thalassotalea atypica]|uniref:hypothetical protein n=1 Tax=Thalassotalea atypica TaxID=2054316 RepID=UPI002572438B|nr:hypothetical protein [Thalassotalea atypica]
MDKSPLDESWESIAQDWQSQPYEHIDVDLLIKQFKKRTMIAKGFIVLNLIATIGLYISFFFGLYDGQWPTPVMAYLGFGAILSTVYVYYEIKIRQQTWRMSDASPEQAIERYISGIEGAIKYCVLMKVSFWALLPAMNWFTYEMKKGTDKSVLPAFIIGNSILILSYAITHHYHKKRVLEKERLENNEID